MEKETYRNIKLGLFVICGTLLLVGAFYFIGNKQNLFGSTFRLSAQFYNVNGLMEGNNVRFAGINVGTVESLEIESDSSVKVSMVLEKRIQKFINRNAVASIGTDGLMGNKLVNINSGSPSPNVENDDVLKTLRPLEMDEMVRTLNTTNENIKVISSNLRSITDRISSKNSLWNLLMDTIVAENVKSSVVNLKLMSNNALLVTGDLKGLSNAMKNGKGTIGALISDTALSFNLKQTIIKFDRLSDTAGVITGNLSTITKKLKRGEGSAGLLLNDTNLVHDLNKSIQVIYKGAGNFDENMIALQHTWPLKRYFKKKRKEAKTN
jgi:phospholipid/cholesterol/gamma-HCH transport system substrate-binding protein